MSIRVLSKLVMVVLIMTVVSVCSVADVRAATSDEYKELVIKAYEKMSGMQSYQMTLETTGSMSIFGQTTNIVMHSECDTQIKPLLAKNVMQITVGDGSAKKEQKITQYIEETKGQVCIYSNTNGKWERLCMPHYDPLAEYANYAKAVTNVALVEENDEISVFAVTMDGSYLKENIEQIMNSSNMQKANLPGDFFKSIGDITYKVAINKKTAIITRTDIDMSDMLAAMGNSIIENEKKLSDAEKTTIREMFNNTKLVMTMFFSKFNSIDKITIPNEVRLNSLPAKTM